MYTYTTPSSSKPSKSSFVGGKGKKSSWLRNQRRVERNEELRRLYPAFQPSANLKVLHVHRQSTTETLDCLIKAARGTKRYVVDTESQDKTLRKGEQRANGALVQIQMLHSATYSTVVLIETCYLPEKHSILYKKIEELCDTIFNNGNEIITWGPIRQEFDTFQHLNLIHLGAIRECDLQFYISNPNQIYDTHPEGERRERTGEGSMEIDTPGDELIIKMDDEEWNFDDDFGDFREKEKLNLPLGLQAVVAEQFGKFLDKSRVEDMANETIQQGPI